MSEKKIVVPDGMLQAACRIGTNAKPILEAALRWLSENPIVPDVDLGNSLISCHRLRVEANAFAEWQRRMFLAPDEDAPIKDLLACSTDDSGWPRDAIREAYRRGKEAECQKR